VSLMGDAENLAGQLDGGAGGQGDQGGQGAQGGADGLVGDVTQDAEKALDSETGDKFDSEIQDAGSMIDQKLPDL
jgi:hypothetical protein